MITFFLNVCLMLSVDIARIVWAIVFNVFFGT